MIWLILELALINALLIGPTAPSSGAAVQSRMTADVAAGRPIVAHIVVALCDNKHQGIVPVPETLGNGQDAESNLYWGAAYGVRTFFSKQAGWCILERARLPSAHVLERIILRKTVQRGGRSVAVYAIAEAWDGREIKAAIERFVRLAAGEGEEALTVESEGNSVTIRAGSAAHVVAYVGHDGLMEFSLQSVPEPKNDAISRSSIVLACASEYFFGDPIETGGSHALLLTTGLMAPEAYALDAAITAWAGAKSPAEVREAAAAAYSRYQKCSLTAARRLFTGSP